MAEADADADAACLRGALLADLRASGLLPGNPRVLMLAGLPGAGKSEFARRVNARRRFLTLESDRLRKSLFPRPEYTGAENRRLFDACHRVMGEFLGQGYPVLFDATNIRERDRAPVYDIARRYDAPLAVVVVTAPRAVVRQRLRRREAGQGAGGWSDAGWAVYCRMAPGWEPVTGPYILADTGRDVGPALRRVLEWAGAGA